mgnify:CR=1 FL=1
MDRILSRKTLARFLKFLLVGASGFAVNAGVYLLLKELSREELFLRVIAPFVSFEISIYSNYCIYHHWVWRDRRKETRREYWLAFLHYNIAAGFGFLIIIAVMNLAIALVPWFRADSGRYIFANLAGAAVAAVFNFLATDRIVFRRKK